MRNVRPIPIRIRTSGCAFVGFAVFAQMPSVVKWKPHASMTFKPRFISDAGTQRNRRQSSASSGRGNRMISCRSRIL